VYLEVVKHFFISMSPKEDNNNTEAANKKESMTSNATPTTDDVGDAAADTSSETSSSTQPSLVCHKLIAFVRTYEFLIMIAAAILIAYAYPPLGAKYLAPDITATWLAVCFIFVLAGLGLKTEELQKAFLNLKFNVLVQIFNFGVVSVVVFGVSRGLEQADIISTNLADGMVCGACVPMTINSECGKM